MTTLEDLEKLAQQRESATVELKSELTLDVLRKLSTKIAALANSSGGQIIFGITDSGDLKGYPAQPEDRDKISTEAKNCSPPVRLDFENLHFGEQKFLIVYVPRTNAVHSDKNQKFPVRIGNLIDYLDGAGIVSLIRERELVQGASSQSYQTTASSYEREPLPDKLGKILLETISHNDSAIVKEGLKDINALKHHYDISKEEKLMDAIVPIIMRDDELLLPLSLEIIRFNMGHSSDERIKSLLDETKNRLLSLGDPKYNFDIMQKAYDILVAARSAEAVNMFMEWLFELDDEHYKAVSPANLFVNLDQELKLKMRARLFEALKTNKSIHIKSRITDAMKSLRLMR